MATVIKLSASMTLSSPSAVKDGFAGRSSQLEIVIMMEEDDGRILVTTGQLFEINRKILNPLGLALIYDEDDGLYVKCDLDNPESMIFDKSTFYLGIKKNLKYMKDYGNKIMKTRQERLGFIVQKPFEVDE